MWRTKNLKLTADQKSRGVIYSSQLIVLGSVNNPLSCITWQYSQFNLLIKWSSGKVKSSFELFVSINLNTEYKTYFTPAHFAAT